MKCYGEPVKISTDSKYLGHDFTTYTGFLWRVGGFTIDSVRAAIDAHDAGSFTSSSMLATVASRWAPIFRALRQREAPALGIERATTGGERGAARRAKEGFAEIMYSRGEPLFGDLFEAKAMLGFQWLHARWVATEDGREQRPELKPWPAAATYVDPLTGQFRAFTREFGMVDMVDGDGKWFLVGDGSAPWLRGAVRALGTQWAGGVQAERNELSLADYLGRKVPIAELPEKVSVQDAVGQEIVDATKNIGKGRSGAVVPHGTKLSTLDNLDSGAAALLQGVLDRRARYVVGALLGTDGGQDSKVYVSPQFAAIARSVVQSDVTAASRAFGRIGDVYGAINFGLSASESPGYRWLLPDPAEAERRSALAKCYIDAAEIVAKEKANGVAPSEERSRQIYADLGAVAPPAPSASTESIPAQR